MCTPERIRFTWSLSASQRDLITPWQRLELNLTNLYFLEGRELVSGRASSEAHREGTEAGNHSKSEHVALVAKSAATVKLVA